MILDKNKIPLLRGEYIIIEESPFDDGTVGIVAPPWLYNTEAILIDTADGKRICRYVSFIRHLTKEEILIYKLSE